MATNMMGNGRPIREMARAPRDMLVEMFILACGNLANDMGLESSTLRRAVIFIEVIGLVESKTGPELTNIAMVNWTLAFTPMIFASVMEYVGVQIEVELPGCLMANW